MGNLYNVDGTTGDITTVGSITSTSVTSGFLPPRLTTTQRDALVSPATGLEIFNTTTNQPEFYNGTAWVGSAASTPGDVNGAVQFNSSGTFGGNNDQLSWDNTGFNLNLTSPPVLNPLNPATGSNLILTTGAGVSESTLNGGSLTITTGNNSNGSNNGGSLTITTGNNSGGNNNGGGLTITTGVGANNVGGNITLTSSTPSNGGNLYLTGTSNGQGQVGVGTASPDPSASLAINSTTRGFLPPRLTTTQRNDISSPAEGLIVYDTTLHQLWEYQNGAWAEVGGGSGTVTSVALTVPSFLSVSGSPITTSGTLVVSFSGTALPIANGGTGQTSFASGALSSNGTTLTSGTLSVANGGTGTSTPSLVAGTNITITGSWPNQTINSTGGGSTVITVSTTYTASTFDIILADATTAPFTVTLPTAASSTNKIYTIKKIDSTSNSVTIQGNGVDTIDGSNTQLLNSQWQSYTMVSDGTSWYII